MTKSIYDQMQSGVFSHPLYRCVSFSDYNFYFLSPRIDSSLLQGRDAVAPGKLIGWKFHLSVGAADVPRAWDIVAEKMMSCGFACEGKVAKPGLIERLSDPKNVQAGKHITMYTRENINPARYKTLLEDIEHAFESGGIARGPASNTDRPILGSAYISYRNDRMPSGERVRHTKLGKLSKEARHNPYGAEDPYLDFTIQPLSGPQKSWIKAASCEDEGDGKNAVVDASPNEGKIHRALSWFLGRSP